MTGGARPRERDTAVRPPVGARSGAAHDLSVGGGHPCRPIPRPGPPLLFVTGHAVRSAPPPPPGAAPLVCSGRVWARQPRQQGPLGSPVTRQGRTVRLAVGDPVNCLWGCGPELGSTGNWDGEAVTWGQGGRPLCWGGRVGGWGPPRAGLGCQGLALAADLGLASPAAGLCRL